MQDEFENALAWFGAAPARWVDSLGKDLSAAAEWIWGVIQGDFNEEASTAQTITGTVISMIPFVDQICDVRDVVACCKRIHHESDSTGNWLALALTLIGLFPTLGSLVKGCGKILFGYARKAALKGGTATVKAGKKLAEKEFAKAADKYIEYGITKLNSFLERPAVRKTLAALHWDNPYRHLAEQMRKLRAQVTVQKLLAAFDKIIDALKDLLGMVREWGGGKLGTQVAELLTMIDGVRKNADKMLAKVLKPLQDWLDRIARRLDVEADSQYRAYLKVTNTHSFTRTTLNTELAEFQKSLPSWVDNTSKIAHPPARKAPVKTGWPDLRKTATGQTRGKFNTFEHGKINAVTIPPGETLYRILDPASGDNSICWMRKAEFDKLKNKDDWRRRFAVWANWNSNGEFVTYTVPPGKGLNVWEGITGTQLHEVDKAYKLEGGAIQIVLDPNDLKKEFLGKRQPTRWGYSNFGETVDMTGVPALINSWIEKK